MKMNIEGTISHIEKRLDAHDDAFDGIRRDVKNLQALVYEHIDHQARHLKEPLEANTPEPHTSDTPQEGVTRLEVIDEDGRVYSRWDARIYLDYQDGGKTLKIFVEQDNDKRD